MGKKLSAIAENIRKFRLERGWAQKRLGEMANLQPKHISQLENGDSQAGRKVIERLCKAFGIEEMTLRFGERVDPEKDHPSVPEHLRLLFQEISKVFPDSAALVRKHEALNRVMRALGEAGD